MLIHKGPNNSSRNSKELSSKGFNNKNSNKWKGKGRNNLEHKDNSKRDKIKRKKRSRATSITNNTMIHRPDSESSPSQTLMNRCRDQDRDRTIYTRPEVHFIKNPKGHNSTNNPSHSHREEGSNSPNITIRLACPGAGSSGT